MFSEIEGPSMPAEKAEKIVPSTPARKRRGKQSVSNGGTGDGPQRQAEKADDAPPSPVDLLVELQKRRRFILKSQSRIDRSTEAFLARAAGYRNDMDAKDRVALFKKVSAVRKAVEKGGGHLLFAEKAVRTTPPPIPSWADPTIILAAAKSRETWDEMRSNTEKQMRTIAKSLPVWRWAEGVRGLGELGVAIIVGEAGDLGSYPSKSHLWKRLGLAVIDGERQKKCANVEKAAAHGYNPSRRSTVYTLADSLFRAQWRKQEGAEVGSPAGPYGEAYAHRRAFTAHREGWTPAHQHADAVRYMSKKLLAHMRAAWIAEAKR